MALISCRRSVSQRQVVHMSNELLSRHNMVGGGEGTEREATTICFAPEDEAVSTASCMPAKGKGCSLCCQLGTAFWLDRVQRRPFETNKFIVRVLSLYLKVGLFKLGGEVFAYFLVDRTGRRPLFIASSSLVTFFLIFLGELAARRSLTESIAPLAWSVSESSPCI